MSLITPDFGLIFWMTVIFGILFFLLAKFGFPMITRMVDSRSERIEQSLRAADEADKKLASLALEQQALIDKTRAEQGRILKEASVAGEAIIAKARENAVKEAADILEKAKRDIETERQSAISDIRYQVAAISMEVAEKVIRHKLEDTDEQQALLDNMVDELAESRLN